MSLNKAAWLTAANAPLSISEAPMPTPGPGELLIRNAAIAINPLDTHQYRTGVFVQSFPAIIGCDVAGTVHALGPGTEPSRFQPGDRVIGHAINLATSLPSDGAYALFTVVQAAKAALLPDHISFPAGAVLPFAIEAAACALCVTRPGVAMPGVSTPALGLGYPSLQPRSAGKVLVVYGGSAAVGAMVTQLATAAGVRVVAVCSEKNFGMSRECGAESVFDYHREGFVDGVVRAVRESGDEFVGVFDAISTPVTYGHDLEMLEKLGGKGHLACVHPPPEEVPEGVKAGMIFAVNDVAAPVFRDYVTAALETGKLKCLPPPLIVGKGLEKIQEALERCEAGVSARKLVVEL